MSFWLKLIFYILYIHCKKSLQKYITPYSLKYLFFHTNHEPRTTSHQPPATKLTLNITVMLMTVMLFSSCVTSNPPPPSVLHADSYTTVESNDKRILPETNELFTVNDAIRIGLANNPDYESTKLSLEQAYNTMYQEIVGYLPSLDITPSAGLINYSKSIKTNGNGFFGMGVGDFGGGTSGTGNVGYNASSSLTLFNGLQREFNILRTYELAKKKDYAMKFARLTLINTIQLAYYNMAMLKSQFNIFTANADFQHQMLEFQKVKFQNNLITNDHVLNFELELDIAKLKVLSLRLDYKIAEYTLAALLGLTTVEFPENLKLMSLGSILETIKEGYNPLGIEYYLDLAIDQNPKLKEVRTSLQAKKYELYSSWGEYSPTITADLGYSYQTANGWKNMNNGTGAFSAGINASWALWDNERIFTIRGNIIKVDIEEQTIYSTWIDIVKSVRTAFATLQTSILKQQIAQKAWQIGQRQRDIVQKKYEMGLENITRLNQVQTLFVTAEMDNASATMDIFRARADLEKACGIQRY
jgi:outer membrane protein TolC